MSLFQFDNSVKKTPNLLTEFMSLVMCLINKNMFHIKKLKKKYFQFDY